MREFIGRDKDLEFLQELFKKRVASFVVMRGRRRIGKSRLIREFGKSARCHVFTGVPPDGETTRQSQLDEFADQIVREFGGPRIRVDSWGDLFAYLGQLCAKGKMILALDEISWIGSKASDFLGQLKTAWDLHFSQNPKLVLIVCGSVSSWISKNILSSTGFVGRISADFCLEELPLRDAAQFWDGVRERISGYEILKVLGVTGGVPRYLEEIRPHQSAEENIRRMCFDRAGILYGEFDRIFSDLFSSRAQLFTEVVEALANGSRSLSELGKALGKSTATLSPYLNDLVQAGFVTDDPTWNLKTMKMSQLKRFRLSDNYLRFYLKYIAPNKKGIERGTYRSVPLNGLPEWDGVMGLQFENLVLNNVPALVNALHMPWSDVAFYGPYFQRATKRQQGCQVDLLIQTRYRSVILCEVKFSSSNVGMEVVHQMREKQERIALSRGWSIRSALIHVNGVTAEVRQSQVFDHIVDFSELLK